MVSGLISLKEKNALCLFDEPTGGLHPTDTLVLLKLFDELIVDGASIVCVTHDEMVSSFADHIIELGPPVVIKAEKLFTLKNNLTSKQFNNKSKN